MALHAWTTHGAFVPSAKPPRRQCVVRQGRARANTCRASASTLAAPVPTVAQVQHTAAPHSNSGHTALLHGLGALGEVEATYMPMLLRLAHLRSTYAAEDSGAVLQQAACGLMAWRAALQRGLLPDLLALQQLTGECAGEGWVQGKSAAELQWPPEPMYTMLLRILAKLDAPRFARKYPAVRAALLRSLLEAMLKYERELAGEKEAEAEREVDSDGNRARTIAELAREEAQKRAARGGIQSAALEDAAAGLAAEQAMARRKAERAAAQAALPPEKRIAMDIVKELYASWLAPLSGLNRAGRAFEGLEALLGGEGFTLGGAIWQRAGWTQLDSLRKKLEDLRELRDLVRSLGRGGGWGPLRRAPIQRLDFSGRPGLMRTVLEAQETRGLTRSDDISRLLPAEAALLARGRTVRAARLLFYARMAEKGLQTYERDGWSEFPTHIVPERREVRPTADRGPILLCVDTSGSMRGARETVAKALALECMRAAREQERDCFVFAFSGPAEVRELELNADMQSVNNLLDFLEKVFNGGSDFNEPVKRCLSRLTDAKWANSDILLVSDGELRAPGHEVMRKLWGAKESLGLRVHGLVIGTPGKQRADPAVLKSLCTCVLPSGKTEVLVSEFSGWASVQADSELAKVDWDDAEGDARRRLANLAHEKLRQQEQRRLRASEKSIAAVKVGGLKNDPMRLMPSDGSGKRGNAGDAFAAKKH